SLERLHDAVPGIRKSFLLSLHFAKRVWLLNLPCQPFSMSPFSRGRKIQDRCMGGDLRFDARPLVSRKSRKLAVFVPVRHDSAALDVSAADGQRPAEINCD